MAACGRIRVEPQPPLKTADAIVVLGNRPPVDAEGNVQPETLRRVKTGVRLWYLGLAPVLLMTGGPAPFGVVEADVMRTLAIRLGVPPERILTERRSRDTVGNARGSVALLCGRAGKPGADCSPEVIVVSSPFHLRRARDLFRCAGAKVQVAETPLPDDRDYRMRFRWMERIVRVAYAFFDACGKARPD